MAPFVAVRMMVVVMTTVPLRGIAVTVWVPPLHAAVTVLGIKINVSVWRTVLRTAVPCISLFLRFPDL